MTDTQTITISNFINKHNLRFECHRVDSRPDGLMDGNNSTGGNGVEMRHWRCRITAHWMNAKAPKGIEARSFGLYFSQGSAHTEAPTLADVLDCLASDSGGYENAVQYARKPKGGIGNDNPFVEWADEYGYDVDSRKAEKTFKAIRRQAQQLKRVIGTEAYEELLWNTERL